MAKGKPTAGYSTTPLWKKLGYKSGMRAFVEGGPASYQADLGLPKAMLITWLTRAEAGLEFVHVFSTNAAELDRKLATLRRQIAPAGVVWVSWPKQVSGVATDLVEDTIRRIALPRGFVDIKVCAVDAVWSGLKLVIRKAER